MGLLNEALEEATKALLEIAKGVDNPRTTATEALIVISTLVGSDPEPFRIALLGLQQMEVPIRDEEDMERS